jgi:tetratricopeptide (TPR) repeat protein
MINDQQLFILGEFYIKKRNYPAAREIFSQLEILNPNSFQILYRLGKTDFKLGNKHELSILFLSPPCSC